MEDICSMIDKIDVEQLKRIKELNVEKLGRSQKLRYCALHVRLFNSYTLLLRKFFVKFMKSFHHVTIIIRRNRTSRSIISSTPPMEQDPSCQIPYLWDKTHHIKYPRRNKTHHIKYPIDETILPFPRDKTHHVIYPTHKTRHHVKYPTHGTRPIMSNTLPRDKTHYVKYPTYGKRPTISNTQGTRPAM